eukprot:361957-Chlamydomonas_euryale.AAC.3
MAAAAWSSLSCTVCCSTVGSGAASRNVPATAGTTMAAAAKPSIATMAAGSPAAAELSAAVGCCAHAVERRAQAGSTVCDAVGASAEPLAALAFCLSRRVDVRSGRVQTTTSWPWRASARSPAAVPQPRRASARIRAPPQRLAAPRAGWRLSQRPPPSTAIAELREVRLKQGSPRWHDYGAADPISAARRRGACACEGARQACQRCMRACACMPESATGGV